MAAWLEEAGGRRYPIRGTLTLGRSSKNAVKIAGEEASRQHALVHSQGFGEYWLVDLGSTNGTRHRGRRIPGTVPLADGDVIEICGTTFVFRATEAPGDRTQATTRRVPQPCRLHRIWMLVADIERSSLWSQRLGVGDFAMLVGSWFRLCREILETHQGVINKYLGDGFLAHWDPRLVDHARVQGALADLWRLRETRDPLFRVVLHCGEVALSDEFLVGEEGVLGSEVHYLFRMEKVAGAAGWPMTLSESAARAFGPSPPVVPLGEREVPDFGRRAFYAPVRDDGPDEGLAAAPALS